VEHGGACTMRNTTELAAANAPLPALSQSFSLPLFCLIYCKVCTDKQADSTKIMAVKTMYMTNNHEPWGKHLNVPQTPLLPNLLLPHC